MWDSITLMMHWNNSCPAIKYLHYKYFTNHATRVTHDISNIVIAWIARGFWWSWWDAGWLPFVFKLVSIDKIHFRVVWVEARLQIRWFGRHCNFHVNFRGYVDQTMNFRARKAFADRPNRTIFSKKFWPKHEDFLQRKKILGVRCTLTKFRLSSKVPLLNKYTAKLFMSPVSMCFRFRILLVYTDLALLVLRFIYSKDTHC